MRAVQRVFLGRVPAITFKPAFIVVIALELTADGIPLINFQVQQPPALPKSTNYQTVRRQARARGL